MLLARVGGRRARAAISFWKKGGKQVCLLDCCTDVKQKSCLSWSSHLRNPVVLRNPNLSNIQNKAIRIFPYKKRWQDWSSLELRGSNNRTHSYKYHTPQSSNQFIDGDHFHEDTVIIPSSRLHLISVPKSSMADALLLAQFLSKIHWKHKKKYLLFHNKHLQSSDKCELGWHVK
jgi:hypothetical protein